MYTRRKCNSKNFKASPWHTVRLFRYTDTNILTRRKTRFYNNNIKWNLFARTTLNSFNRCVHKQQTSNNMHRKIHKRHTHTIIRSLTNNNNNNGNKLKFFYALSDFQTQFMYSTFVVRIWYVGIHRFDGIVLKRLEWHIAVEYLCTQCIDSLSMNFILCHFHFHWNSK